MIIKADRLDAIAKDPTISALLLHGPDHGKIKHYQERLAALIQPDGGDFNRLLLPSRPLTKDHSALVEETGKTSLMGGRRVITLSDADDTLKNACVALFDDRFFPHKSSFVIICAGILKKNSPLRLLFEKQKHAAALTCYANSLEQNKRLVEHYCASKLPGGSRRKIIDAVVALLGEDSALNKRELEKLSLYTHDLETITLEDVHACLTDNDSQSLEDIAYGVADGHIQSTSKAIGRALATGLSPIAIIRAAYYHFNRLYMTTIALDQGQGWDAVLRNLHPPIFFQKRNRFHRQAMIWRPSALAKSLERLLAGEISAKQTHPGPDLACQRCLTSLAHYGATLQRLASTTSTPIKAYRTYDVS